MSNRFGPIKLKTSSSFPSSLTRVAVSPTFKKEGESVWSEPFIYDLLDWIKKMKEYELIINVQLHKICNVE